jgi:acyl CoA:acetate/3-ketoacid CoA transferase alpha subunit
MRTLSLADAVALIPDGASLMIGGFMAVGTLRTWSTNWCARASATSP